MFDWKMWAGRLSTVDLADFTLVALDSLTESHLLLVLLVAGTILILTLSTNWLSTADLTEVSNEILICGYFILENSRLF